MLRFFCDINARLLVPHQIRNQFLCCSSRGYSGTWGRKRNWPRYRPRDSAVHWLILSESLLLSGQFDWRPSSRRSHHGDLFSFSSVDDSCSSNVAQWQISKSHLDGRLPHRLLLWVLPHVLGCTYPINNLSCSTDIEFGTECSGRVFGLRYSYPDTG